MKTYRIQEIVFAELDGIMEEKMKNYSSGMRSRLAFAIATAGDVSNSMVQNALSKGVCRNCKNNVLGASCVIVIYLKLLRAACEAR